MAKTLRRLFGVFIVCFLTFFIFIHPAISDESANEEIPLNQYGIRSTNPYVVDRFIEDGKSIDRIIVPGPPDPPEGFVRAQVTDLPEPDIAAGTNTLANVPAMTWVFGCSATSAAMMFGYYDNSGYPDMYTGPTNGGVFPMTNATWGTVVINTETRALCPLSATRNGLDGRVIKGHVDDYWVKYGNAGPDPFIGNWAEHTHGECTGDYMGTNQSQLGNTDGSTTFYNYTDGSPLYDYVPPAGHRDGGHGMRLFVESRGYTVQANGNFNQYIQGQGSNPALGFTFANFKAEIDAGRPVMIQVTGHTMLGYGYNDTGSIIYIHDTWDYLAHSMTWGGTYSGMQHYGVTVLRLALLSCTYSILPTSATGNASGGSGSISVTASAGTCAWTATRNASWITITSGSSGTGNGTVNYSYTANDTGSQRQGTITAAGQTFTLTQEPQEPLDTPLSNGVALNQTMTAPVSQGTWKYYYLDLPSGSTNLVTQLYNLTGDLDLYVRQGAKPTLSSYNCRPYFGGTSSESCTFSSPTSGRWWVGVNNWATGTNSYTVKASWTENKGLPGVLLLLLGD